jgi:hypothetical protein
MNSEKTMIADAVSRLRLRRRPEWAALRAVAGDVEVASIEPDPASIHTVDMLFDSEALIVLSDKRALHATVFGRFTANRVEVDRIVLEE